MLRLRHAIALAAFALAATFAAPASAAKRTDADCRAADAVPSTATLGSARAAAVCLVNQQRALYGLTPLIVNGDLTDAARDYVGAMTARGFFSHVAPDGSTPAGRIKVTDYLVDARSWSVGENIGAGAGGLATPRQMVLGWMRSPSHRRNVLSPRYRHIGVGIAAGTPAGSTARGATYAAEFGLRIIARPSRSPRR